MRTLSVIWSLLILLQIGGRVNAQGLVVTGNGGGPVDNVYFPGYVDVDQMPLDLFVPKALHLACVQLEEGNLAAARGAFSAYTRSHSDVLAPYIGYLQARRGDRANLLPVYEREASENKSAVNEFRLGVLAFYLMGEHYLDGADSRTKALRKIARASLEKAYSLSHAPVAGFVLLTSYNYTGGGPGDKLAEDMMRRLGGENVYAAYVRAKSSNWSGPIPGVPKLSYNDLQQFRHLVYILWSPNVSIQTLSSIELVDGQQKRVERRIPNSPEQNRIGSYLGAWRQELAHAALAAQG